MITVVVPVKNDNARLVHCLSSLTDFDDVLVVESEYNTKTKEICKKFGVRFEVFTWNGQFPKKRNWILDNLELKYEWILFLDSDELVPLGFKELLCASILKLNYSAYYLFYENLFKGEYLKYGVPQRKIALFKRHHRFEKVSISAGESFDMEVHEHPVITTKVGRIKKRLMHNEYRTADKFILKHVEYARWEASQIKSRKERGGTNLRQRVKYRFIQSPFFPFMYFILHYIFFLGFLDGTRGLEYAKKKMWYFSLVRELLNEKN